MSEARKQLREIIDRDPFTRFDGMLLVSPEVAAAALDDPITVHVAVVELTEDLDPLLFVARTLDDLYREIREGIESEVLDMLVPEWRPEVYEYIAERRGDGTDWATWHDGLHELDGTPWVTIEEKEL